MDSNQNQNQTKADTDMTTTNKLMPGAFLAAEREKKGISIDYIADKLNLRAQVLIDLESDAYHSLPQPVFVNGYIRAYCKLLDLSQVDELVEAYAILHPQEVKYGKPLFQNPAPKDVESAHFLRWITSGFALIAVAAVGFWLYQNKGNEKVIPQKWRQNTQVQQVSPPPMVEKKVDVNLTDLKKMRQILDSQAANVSYIPQTAE